MNTKNIAALLMDNCKTIGVTFSSDANEHKYIYKTIEDFEVDDFVIVKSKGRLKMAQVAEIHKIPQIDSHSDRKLEWIVQKLDITTYNELNKREDEFRDQLLQLEQASVKKQALHMLTENLGLDSKLLASSVKKLNEV